MNKKDQNQTATIIIVSLAVLLIVGIVGYTFFHDTYAAGTYNVVFHYAESSKGIVKTCKTDSSGKINSHCADFADEVCQSWSPEAWDGYSQPSTQGSQKTTATIAGATYTSNVTYYCVAHKSTGQKPACLTCKSDSSIYQWGLYKINEWTDSDGTYHFNYGAVPENNGTGDSCSGGWDIDRSSSEDDCSQCFQCKADTNVYKWATDAWGDGECPGGYSKTNKAKADCKTVTTTSSTTTSSTTKSTTKSTTTTTTTKKPTPACYECKADKNIMKWKNDATGDNACPGGYDKTTKTQAQCVKEPVNPPTGQTGIFFTWIASVVAILCSLWYLKKSV